MFYSKILLLYTSIFGYPRADKGSGSRQSTIFSHLLKTESIYTPHFPASSARLCLAWSTSSSLESDSPCNGRIGGVCAHQKKKKKVTPHVRIGTAELRSFHAYVGEAHRVGGPPVDTRISLPPPPNPTRETGCGLRTDSPELCGVRRRARLELREAIIRNMKFNGRAALTAGLCWLCSVHAFNVSLPFEPALPPVLST